MASQAEIDQPAARRGARRIGLHAALAVLTLILVGLAAAWLSRERIAASIISNELKNRGIEATYEIEQIGGRREILTNIVVGDPEQPDLTIERAEVTLRYRFGFPAIGSVRLEQPRLFGTYVEGELSFGELDPLIFTGEEGPFEFPDLQLTVSDGRALIEGDHGPVAIKLDGSGHMRDGFAGEIAALSPRLQLSGCEAVQPTLYGRVSIKASRPRFEGPLRAARLACVKNGITLNGAAIRLSAQADETLAAFEGEAAMQFGPSSIASNRLASLDGTADFSWREGGLTSRYELNGRQLITAQVMAGDLSVDGWLRARRNFERVEIDADIRGQVIRLGNGPDAVLARGVEATRDTMLAPLISRLRRGLAAEARASSLTAELSLRRTGEQTSVVIPAGSLRGSSGATLLALSRLQFAAGREGASRFSGNFATGGQGLPRIAGRIDRRPGGAVQLRLNMAEYAAGEARLALPDLVLTYRADGAIGFAGQVLSTGAFPGGSAEGLVLPIVGSWSSSRGLALWNECVQVRFDGLRVSTLDLDRRSLTLCPQRGTAIVRYDDRGLRIAAGVPAVEVSGRLSDTPVALRSGPVGLAYPGVMSARELLVTLGPADTATTFAVKDLTARFGPEIGGQFEGTDVRLFAVPLDLLGASGEWEYADGRLVLTDGSFRLQDRQVPARFYPLTAEGASLTLEANLITADALLREPGSGRAVARVDIAHDLSSGRGHADLAVEELMFDERLQPETLTMLALGVVANTRGTVVGRGRIDWNESAVTSSGRFSSDALDFAAAFGPVKGASGTIEFTDLLGLTTAPNQRLRVASINSGIEVRDGEVAIEIRNGEVLALRSGTWPFMGGTLTMLPVDINFGEAEVRRYVLEVEGLDAARFVEHMELNNIAATGIFDGTVPIVFDIEGNGRLEEGLLLSRPPGGNVSYVGELTYEDLGAVANFAFSTLRSLDYRQMRIAIEGPLTGEIITRVRIDGVSQGANAERNFLTRAIAGIPIRLDLNVRAQFYTLLGNIRSMYDPSAIRNPNELAREGRLRDAHGNVVGTEDERLPDLPSEQDTLPDEDAIQRRESEETP